MPVDYHKAPPPMPVLQTPAHLSATIWERFQNGEINDSDTLAECRANGLSEEPFKAIFENYNKPLN